MQIHIINPHTALHDYITKLQQGALPDQAWEECVIVPYWQQLCCYAPFDLSDRKPKPITNLPSLKAQLAILETLDISKFQQEFERITTILPNYDDDPLTVAFFPLSTEDEIVNEKQNGVVGTSLFGNLIIQFNPLKDGFEDWVSYVFAHEYHHTVWGNYWFMLHGGSLENKFIDSLFIDGEADSFALELYPHLTPQWIFGLPKEEIITLFEQQYRSIVLQTDVDYIAYMFGNKEKQIPWCAGYAIGYYLVQTYLQQTNQTVLELLERKPEELYLELENSYVKISQSKEFHNKKK